MSLLSLIVESNTITSEMILAFTIRIKFLEVKFVIIIMINEDEISNVYVCSYNKKGFYKFFA